MRAKGMQVLTNQVKTKRPGVTIYGVGDDDHKLRVSGHNEDDTPGVRAEDQDSDNIPEHRAIDVMLGSSFSRADGQQLFDDLVRNRQNQVRLLYVIFDGHIASASRGWTVRDLDPDDDQHGDHVHVSGEADADENESPWQLSDWTSSPSTPSGELAIDGKLGPLTITKWQQIMGTTVDGKIDPKDSQLVRAVQERLKATVDHRLVVDGQGIYQNNRPYKTAGALQRYLKSPVDQIISAPVSQVIKALQRRLNEGRF